MVTPKFFLHGINLPLGLNKGNITYQARYMTTQGLQVKEYTFKAVKHDLRHAIRLSNFEGFQYLKGIKAFHEAQQNKLNDIQDVIDKAQIVCVYIA